MKQHAYHHGNLRQCLLDETLRVLQRDGTEAVSLRKLAEAVGVSRSALYHHFQNKDDLLAAIAQMGFTHLYSLLDQIQPQREPTLALRDAVMGYLMFARDHAAQYQLMFGQRLWDRGDQEGFQRYAKDCFRRYVELFESLQEQGLVSRQETPLKLAQLLWASLHGLAVLMQDGVLVPKEDLDDLVAHLVRRYISID